METKSNHFARWLKKSGMTQTAFSEKIGIAQGPVSIWLHEGVSPKHMLKVSKVTKIPCEKLLKDRYG